MTCAAKDPHRPSHTFYFWVLYLLPEWLVCTDLLSGFTLLSSLQLSGVESRKNIANVCKTERINPL